jgi:mono/diheme cytochrome c family protein
MPRVMWWVCGTRSGQVWLCAVAALVGFALALGERLDASPKEPSAADDRGLNAKRYDEQIRPFLTRHCLGCHGTEKPKGDLRLDRLAPDFADPASRDKWQTVLKRLKAGEMPPKSKSRPAEQEIRLLADWISGSVRAAEAARRSQGRVVLRRLNRVEYENTVRDLLGVHIDLQDLLPLDNSAAGFDNVSEALHTSSFLMEKYLEAADKALSVAIANGPQPSRIKKRYSLKDSHQVKSTTERVFRKFDDDTVVMFSSSAWQAVNLHQFYPPDRGKYRFRISASGFQSDGKPVTYRVDAGAMGMAGKSHLIGYFDAPADKPAVMEFVDHLEARSTIRLLPYGLASAQAVNKIGADNYQGAGLAVQWLEVEGPLHESWPPDSHRRIFGDLPQTPAPVFNNRNRVEVASKSPEADAERILRAFARRAFRRAVTDEDLRPFLTLVKAKLAEKYTFEQAVRVGLMGVMVSPDFLFLREKVAAASRAAPNSPARLAGPTLDDFALASRLSYFLWSTMPDEELLTLAEQRKLSQPATLRRQVERMLKDAKAAAFTENFVSQWLGLRDIDATMPSHILYPEYDDMLKQSMLKETYLFFDELLKHDLSVTNFVHSDFTMLNGRLAKHYGIPTPLASGERGRGDGMWEFKKVSLPKDSHRGGLLTMASVLKVTANGTYTSPILRGAWVLDRILGTPPPRPPEGVAAVEPDIRGATTIREQLAKHRSVASCASCHSKIDPPGFALESFDVIGGWRTYYRTSGNGKAVIVDGRRMPYLQGKNVDPADVMPDGRRFENIDEFKQLLLKDKDQLARALTERLVTYATGAACQTADQREIEAIVRSVRDRNYGLRTLVHEIVQSNLFQSK